MENKSLEAKIEEMNISIDAKDLARNHRDIIYKRLSDNKNVDEDANILEKDVKDNWLKYSVISIILGTGTFYVAKLGYHYSNTISIIYCLIAVVLCFAMFTLGNEMRRSVKVLNQETKDIIKKEKDTIAVILGGKPYDELDDFYKDSVERITLTLNRIEKEHPDFNLDADMKKAYYAGKSYYEKVACEVFLWGIYSAKHTKDEMDTAFMKYKSAVINEVNAAREAGIECKDEVLEDLYTNGVRITDDIVAEHLKLEKEIKDIKSLL